MNNIDFTLQDMDEPKRFFDAESRLGEPVAFISSGRLEEVPDQYADSGSTQVVVADYVVTLSPETGIHHVEEDVYVRHMRLRHAILAAAGKASGAGVVGGYVVKEGQPFELRPFPPETRGEVSQMLADMNQNGALRQSEWEYGFPPPTLLGGADE